MARIQQASSGTHGRFEAVVHPVDSVLINAARFVNGAVSRTGRLAS